VTQTPPPGAAWSPTPAPATPGYPSTAAPSGTSGLAVASLVLGITGCVLFACFLVVPILAVILGYLALDQIADSGGARRGRGMAIAGVTLGWVWIGVVGVLAVIWIIITLAA
jgi:hypothetical protein